MENDWIIIKSVYFDILEKQKCFCEGDPELSMTRNCRVHCSILPDESHNPEAHRILKFNNAKYFTEHQFIIGFGDFGPTISFIELEMYIMMLHKWFD